MEVRDGEQVVLPTQVAGVEMFMVDPPPEQGRIQAGDGNGAEATVMYRVLYEWDELTCRLSTSRN